MFQWCVLLKKKKKKHWQKKTLGRRSKPVIFHFYEMLKDIQMSQTSMSKKCLLQIQAYLLK